jgi:transcriptional regulator with XRE-family HTH domain
MVQENGPDGLARLGRYVTAARNSAGYATLKALSDQIGVSTRTLVKLENGTEPVSDNTLSKVAAAVGWSPDSPRLVMRGGEPRPRIPVAGTGPEPAAPQFPPHMIEPDDEAMSMYPGDDEESRARRWIWRSAEKEGKPHSERTRMIRDFDVWLASGSGEAAADSA